MGNGRMYGMLDLMRRLKRRLVGLCSLSILGIVRQLEKVGLNRRNIAHPYGGCCQIRGPRTPIGIGCAAGATTKFLDALVQLGYLLITG